VNQTHVGMSATGAGVPAGAFVGTIIDSTHFMLSDRRTRQNGALQFNGVGVAITLTWDTLTYQSQEVVIREIIGRNSGGQAAGPLGDTYVRSANGINHEAGYVGLIYPGRVMIQYNGIAAGNFGFPGGNFRALINGSTAFNPNPPTQEATLATLAGGGQAVAGANTLQTIRLFMQMMTDDGASYFELYANDITTSTDADLLATALRAGHA
jgi:hypothetical protein